MDLCAKKLVGDLNTKQEFYCWNFLFWAAGPGKDLDKFCRVLFISNKNYT